MDTQDAMGLIDLTIVGPMDQLAYYSCLLTQCSPVLLWLHVPATCRKRICFDIGMLMDQTIVAFN